MKLKSLSLVGILFGVFVVGVAASVAIAGNSMVNIAELKMVEPGIRGPLLNHCTFKVVHGVEVAAKVHMVLKHQDHGKNFVILTDKEVAFLPEMMADGVYTQVIGFGPSPSGNRFRLTISVIDVNENESNTLTVDFLGAS